MPGSCRCLLWWYPQNEGEKRWTVGWSHTDFSLETWTGPWGRWCISSVYKRRNERPVCSVYCAQSLSCISLIRCFIDEQWPARYVLLVCSASHRIWDQEEFSLARLIMTVMGREKNEGSVFAPIYVLGSSGHFRAYEESHVMTSAFGPSSSLPLTHWSSWGIRLGLCCFVVAWASLRRQHKLKWYQGLSTAVLGGKY